MITVEYTIRNTITNIFSELYEFDNIFGDIQKGINTTDFTYTNYDWKLLLF